MRKVDLTGKRFGHLYVVSEAPMYISPKGYKKTMWNCRCDCGNECVAMGSHLTTGHTVSCGCVQRENLKLRKATDLTYGLVKSCGCLNISHAERLMFQYLDERNIAYKFQYSPDGLYGVGGGKLSFDFALYTKFNQLILVELDGRQHFEPVAYFGGDEKYERVKFNDAEKDKYCSSNNIVLIRVDVSNCTTEESFLKMYEFCLSTYIDELTNSLNI